MATIQCLGEVLIDWLCPEGGATLATASTFLRAPGGAPANVAVGLARLGVAVGFLGAVSVDPWGDALLSSLAAEGIEIDGVVRRAATTRMAYILLDDHGERHLAAFTRGGCADSQLRPHDLRPESFTGLTALYVGSLLQARASSARAIDRAIGLAQEAGALVVYDPNYRPVFWDDPARAREAIAHVAAQADLLKLGVDEALFLTGEHDPLTAARAAQERFLPALVVVTDGPRGVTYVRDLDAGHVGAPSIGAVDPTGAGDAFVAGLLGSLLPELGEGDRRERLATLPEATLRQALVRANAMGALVATRTGAMSALPTALELETWLRARGEAAPADGGWS